MSVAQKIIADLMPMENEVEIVCEMLRDLGRCTEMFHWRFKEERMFKFEDGSFVRFGLLGPYADA